MFRGTSGYTTQAGLGGAAWSGLPSSTHRYGLKPRSVIVKGNLTSVKRRIVVFTSAAYDAIVPMTTTFLVADATNTQETATVQSKEGERHHGAGVLG